MAQTKSIHQLLRVRLLSKHHGHKNKKLEKIIKIIKCQLQKADNRLLSVLQKFLLFNTFIVPNIEYFSKIFSGPVAKHIQSLGYRFIWKGKKEKLKIT